MIIQIISDISKTVDSLIILDRDDTLISDSGGEAHFSKFKINNELVNYLKEYASKVSFAVATNQSYIEKGITDHNTLIKFHNDMSIQLNTMHLPLKAIAYCPHLTKRNESLNCSCRKPGNAMLEALISLFRIEANRTLFIGNRDSDLQAALKSGTFYCDVKNVVSDNYLDRWLDQKC